MVHGKACARPTAFISDGVDLYQVIGPGKKDNTIIEDARTGRWSEVNTWRLKTEPWFLAREAVEEVDDVALQAG